MNSATTPANRSITPAQTVGSAGITALGDGMARAVLPLIAVSISSAPWAVGVVQAVGRLPWLLVALPVGAYADLRGFRPVARAGLALKIVGVVCLVVAMFMHLLWLAAVGGFITVAGEVAFETAVQTSLLEVFPPAQRIRGNGQLYAWQVANGQFVGPSLGGVLFALNGHIALLLTLVLHVFAGMTRRERVAPTKRLARAGNPVPLARSMLQGFPALVTLPGLRGTTFIGTLSMLAYGLWSAVFLAYVTGSDALDLDVWIFGLLLACPALGCVLGVFAATLLLRHISAFGCVLAMILGQIGLFLPGATQAGVVFVLTGLVGYGAGLGAWNSGVLAYRQATVPAENYGRVTAAYRVTSWGAAPLGALFGAWLVTVANLHAVFFVGLTLVASQLLVVPLVLPLREFDGK